tara:strand:- start:2299 stop:3429 length:1131 start_codon:yes stop_codon:yes gene_type:complete
MLEFSEKISISAVFIFGISLITTIFLIPAINQIGQKYDLIDKPNKRKVHKENIVRIGGLGILIGFLLGSTVLITMNNYFQITEINYKLFILLIIGSTGFFIIGLFDDIYNYSPFKRLILQIILSSILFGSGLKIDAIDISWINSELDFIILNNLFSYFFIIFWIVGITNAFNWLDGLDGLAAGLSTLIIINFCFFYISTQSWDILLLSLSLCGAIVGFLRYNIYPAKILMGDGGSYLLGSNIAIASIYKLTTKKEFFESINNQVIQNLDIFLINIALLIMLIPIADMTFVILNRVKKRKSPFYPDKSHFHHKLLKLGLHPRRVVIIIYSLQITLSCIAILIYPLKGKVFYLCLATTFILLAILYLYNIKKHVEPKY